MADDTVWARNTDDAWADAWSIGRQIRGVTSVEVTTTGTEADSRTHGGRWIKLREYSVCYVRETPHNSEEKPMKVDITVYIGNLFDGWTTKDIPENFSVATLLTEIENELQGYGYQATATANDAGGGVETYKVQHEEYDPHGAISEDIRGICVRAFDSLFQEAP